MQGSKHEPAGRPAGGRPATGELLVTFPTPLLRGRILARRNRFIFDVTTSTATSTATDPPASPAIAVDVAGGDIEAGPPAVVQAHCPTTGRIGDLVVAGLECLLSRSDQSPRTSTGETSTSTDETSGTTAGQTTKKTSKKTSSKPARKTAFTVEAVGVPDTRTGDLTWVGINQNAANRYVETALTRGALDTILPVRQVRREARLGASRLDFLVNDDTYLEVKTPLQTIQVPTPPELDATLRRKVPAFDSTDRLVRHITELADSLGQHQRAILLTCFLYDNPGFRTAPSARADQVGAAVADAVARGVELWQVNLPLTPTGIRWPSATPLNLTH
jgi:sugar fermentation stimulation protein A